MAEPTKNSTDASDEDIESWYTVERAAGKTDAQIDDSFIDIMCQSYERALREQDAVRLSQFEQETIHWSGRYAPMFPETGPGSDYSGRSKVGFFRDDLAFKAKLDRKQKLPAATRLRRLHKIYERHVSGAQEHSEVITMALVGEWAPALGWRPVSGVRAAGPTGGGGKGGARGPGPKGLKSGTPAPQSQKGAEPLKVPALKDGAAMNPAAVARALVAKLKGENRQVIVNIGGAGAPHEPAHAINVNPQVKGTERIGIPNHVNASGETIGQLFEPATVHRIEGHNLPPTVLNWGRIAPGAYRVLVSGGKVEIYFRGSHGPDAARLAGALRDAGFQKVEVVSDVLITAQKP